MSDVNLNRPMHQAAMFIIAIASLPAAGFTFAVYVFVINGSYVLAVLCAILAAIFWFGVHRLTDKLAKQNARRAKKL